MDSNTESTSQDGIVKKNTLDELNRDELLNKCKGFLAIAHRAKQAKTDLQNEVEDYKIKLNKCESEKKFSQDNVKTLQELVDSLTEQKLSYITEIDLVQNKLQVFNKKCNDYEEEIKKLNDELIEKNQQISNVTKNLSDLDSEVISLKRQNNRLLEENEQLINQLTDLEAQIAEFNEIGLQQREQLTILEEKVHPDEDYKSKIEELNTKIKELEESVQASHIHMQDEGHIEYENKLQEITKLYESEKAKKEKANVKLRSYKDKILKCATCINQLKNSRFILSKTVKEYSENIPKWQNDIIKASKVLEDKIYELTNNNKSLKEKLLEVEKKMEEKSHNQVDVDEYKSKYIELTNEKDCLKVDLTNLQNELDVLSNTNSAVNVELSELQVKYKQVTDELHLQLNEKKLLNQNLDDSIQKLNNLSLDNNDLNDLIKDLTDKLQNSNVSMQNQMHTDSEMHKSHINELKKENNILQHQLSNLQKQLSDLSDTSHAVNNELSQLKIKYQDLNETVLPEQRKENKLLKDQINELLQKYNSVSLENTELNNVLKDLKTKNLQLNESNRSKMQNADAINNLNLQIKALESEKAMLVKEKFNARDCLFELESHNKTLTEQLNNMRSEVQTMKSRIETLSQEKSAYETNYKLEKDSEINNMLSKIKTLQEQYDLVKKEHDNLQDLNGLLREEVETLKLSLEQPKDDNLSDLNVSLQTDIVKLESKLSAYKQENASLLAEVKDSRVKVKEYDAMVTEYEDAKAKLMGYKTENNELLNEMKEINQVLKERGEAISKLQKAVTEMERLIDTLEKDRDSVSQEKEELKKKIGTLENELKNAEQKYSKGSEASDQIISERDNALKSLADKDNLILCLKDEIEKLKLQQTSTELANEDMSTSTISKAEEHSRMKDLDETFEEKYTKLRIFALKLKKKLNETMTQLHNTEQDKAKLEKLLHENDLAENKPPPSGDEVDGGDREEYKEKISDLEKRLISLKEIVENSEKVSAELEKVKAELNNKTQELSAERESHKATKENLDKARRDVKKKNVLSLEMEDYERSMKELTSKMEDSKKKMVQMESTIDTQEGTIIAMRTQIKLLEEQIRTDETQMRLVKEDLHRAIEEKKEKENDVHTKNNIISKLEQDLEDEKRKNEEANLEMTRVLSDKEKIIMKLGEDKIELNNKVKRLEFKCAEHNENLRIMNIELADLKTEYTSYKVRAQAVLRQNQTIDHSQEEQLKEEAAALRAQLETLTAKLTTLQEQCSEQSAEVEASKRRAAEAGSEVARAQQRTSRLQTDLTRLGQQLESERTQHKLQVSTLTQCYKTQISELEAKIQKETEVLKKQLALAQENVTAAKVGTLDQANHNQYMLPIIPKEENSDGEMDINVSMIPREDGEGSESAPSPPLSKSYLTSAGSGRSPVPLERLLEEGVPEDETLDTGSLGLTSDQEISELRRKMQALQQRVKHVTVLLSESERECARMAQLAELLKSELRRVRGSTQNAHNTEYMKNVTLKFLTLPPGDERIRLVPVLQKILTLTSEEMHKLQAIAKGLDPNPSKGWGSYLPWPGGK